MNKQEKTVGEAQSQVSKDKTTLAEAVDSLSRDTRVIRRKVQDFQTKLDVDFGIKSKFYLELDDLAKKHGDLLKQLKTSSLSQSLAQQLEANLSRSRKEIQECKDFRPRTGSFFLRLFLGQTNVVEVSMDQKLKLKAEYNKFKYRTTFLFILFPALLYYMGPGWQQIDTIWHVWLLYYYVSLGLRENILRVNGSNIRRWWILHHYFSILLSITMLTWPRDDETMVAVRERIMQYAVFQGGVQVLQNAYQTRRLYTTRAMGRAGQLDVAETETLAVTSMTWQFTLLIPLLCTLQVLQALGGSFLLKQWVNQGGHWQVAVSGIILICLASGNMLTTFKTVVSKCRGKSVRRRPKPSGHEHSD